MAEYNNAKFTKAGRNLHTKALAGTARIEFVSVATGNGEWSEDESLFDAQSLGNPIQMVPINSIDKVNNNTVVIKTIISNLELVEGYEIKEVGLYARNILDESEPILYSITTAIVADFLPPYNGEVPASIIHAFYATVSDANNVVINTNGAFALAEDLEELRKIIGIWTQYTSLSDLGLTDADVTASGTLATICEAMSNDSILRLSITGNATWETNLIGSYAGNGTLEIVKVEPYRVHLTFSQSSNNVGEDLRYYCQYRPAPTSGYINKISPWVRVATTRDTYYLGTPENAMSNGDDLDNYKTVGLYRNNVQTNTLLNCPTTRHFKMSVENLAAGSHILQTIKDTDGFTFMRTNMGTWGAWVKHASQSEVDELKKSVVDGKASVATAINSKGVAVASDATFSELAAAILKIETYRPPEQPSQVSNFKTEVGSETSGYVKITWTVPSDTNYKGVVIRYKTGGYPTSAADGTQAYMGTGNSATLTNLVNGTTYYFRAFAYNYNGTEYAYNSTTSGAQATGTPYLSKGQQIFNSSGTFTVPYGVTSIQVFAVGGGAAGGYGVRAERRGDDGYEGYPSSGGGGGGGLTKTGEFTVSSGANYSVIVGAGGISSNTPSNGQNGGTSSFGSLLSAGGGSNVQIKSGATSSNSMGGGAGGSGGGAGADFHRVTVVYAPGTGGSNGGNGGDSAYSKGGTGQGITTRAFGDSNGTVYAGGGGGADGYNSSNSSNVGGSGGGGKGGVRGVGSAGTANTGGGGGGGAAVGYNTGSTVESFSGGNGGSGVVIVRWGY